MLVIFIVFGCVWLTIIINNETESPFYLLFSYLKSLPVEVKMSRNENLFTFERMYVLHDGIITKVGNSLKITIFSFITISSEKINHIAKFAIVLALINVAQYAQLTDHNTSKHVCIYPAVNCCKKTLLGCFPR